MTHREIVEVLVGLMSALFVAVVTATIVSTALPTIIADLNGSQTQYTWVVTASLLAMTVSSPIWSKFSDLYSKKLLVQLAIGVFLVGSLAAGAVQNVPELLAARAVQGLGMGGLIALAQSILGSIIPPRERGRYSGYLAATMAVATVSGPLLGGVIVDAAGWRWCFWIAIPFALVGLVMLQKYLHLETVRREIRVDYWGALFITIAASLPLVWVSFAGSSFDWLSIETAEFLGAALVALVAAVVVERRHSDPLVPPKILRNRITQLSILGSLAVGVAQFGASVFLSQYFQVARDHTPTEAGLLMLPLIAGNMIGATGSGQYITRTGRWKGIMLAGCATLVAGPDADGHDRPHHAGLAPERLHGADGPGHRVADAEPRARRAEHRGRHRHRRGQRHGQLLPLPGRHHRRRGTRRGAGQQRDRQDRLGPGRGRRARCSTGGGDVSSLDLAKLPPAVAVIVRTAYADATGRIFLIAGIIAVVTFVAVALMPVTELRTTIRKVEDDRAGRGARWSSVSWSRSRLTTTSPPG